MAQKVTGKLYDPAKFIGTGHSIWKGPIDGDGLEGEEDIDPRSLELTEIDVSKMIFEICLEKYEYQITGEEKLHRLKAKPYFIRYGANVFITLCMDYQENKKNSALEWLYRNKKIGYLDFFGIILAARAVTATCFASFAMVSAGDTGTTSGLAMDGITGAFLQVPQVSS